MRDMTGTSLISADSHVIEPPDVFTARLPAKLRDRAPRLDSVRGVCRWSVAGESATLPDSVVNGSGWRRPPHGPRSFEDVLPALYDPAQRLVAQDADGVAAEVLYPFPGLWDAIRATADHELILGCVRAYNDWIAEFGAHSPDRLIGLGRIPVTGFDDALDELLRCVNDLGLRGIILDAWPALGPAPGRGDDGFWEVVDAMGVPVSIHYTLGGLVPVRLWRDRPGPAPTRWRMPRSRWWRPGPSTAFPMCASCWPMVTPDGRCTGWSSPTSTT